MELDPITYSLCYIAALWLIMTERVLEYMSFSPESVGFGWIILLWMWFLSLILLIFIGIIHAIEYLMEFLDKSIKNLKKCI